MQVIRDKRSNRYCGPAALSILTGRHVDEVTAMLREESNRQAIRRTAHWELNLVLARCGLQMQPFGFYYAEGARPTLAAWLRLSQGQRTAGRRFLLAVTGHWVVISGRKLYDNKHREGVYIRQYEHRRVRVKQVWEVAR